MFDVSNEDADKIVAIVQRARSNNWIARNAQIDLIVTITAWHVNNPLDLDKFLAFDNFNLLHDVRGIAAHFDPATGKPDGRFSPRSTR